MRLCYTALALLLASGIAIAQDVDQKSKTNVKVDDGKSTTVTGCIERNADGGFMLTNVAGKDGARGSYLLAATTDDNDLDDIHKHVGERVEITGKAADQGKGKLKVETKAEGTTGKTESKSEVSGDLKGLPYLGVKSFRVLASVCP